MSYSPSLPSRYQIDVIDQVTRAYRIVLDRTQLVLEMALLPFVIVLAIELIQRLSFGATLGMATTGFMTGGFLGWGLILIVNLIVPVAIFLVFGVFVVRWHRFVLLGESVSGELIPPGWSSFVVAGLQFFACWIVLLVIAVLPPHAITSPLSMIGSIVLLFLFLRVSLIFPAAAIEQPVTLRTAWDWIEGNYWRLLACAIACFLPFALVEVVIVWVGALFPSLLWVFFEALRLAVSFVGTAVVAALLSHVYLAIAGGTPQSAE